MEIHKSCGLIPYFMEDGKIYFLLVQGRHNHWGFPKGHIEKGENCEQTALREFEEETGIKPDFVELEPNFKAEDSYFFTLDGKKIKKYVTYFLGELKPGFEKFIKPQEGEITDIKLIPAEQVEKYIKFASLKKIFKKALDYLTNYRKGRLL